MKRRTWTSALNMSPLSKHIKTLDQKILYICIPNGLLSSIYMCQQAYNVYESRRASAGHLYNQILYRCINYGF